MSDIIFKQLPWPNKGDRVFVGRDDDWYYNACLNWSRDPIWSYVSGFKEAADDLIAVVKQDRSKLDSAVYPICFLYRHYLEISLKQLIRQGRRLTEQRGRFPKTHDLMRLWREAKRLLEQIEPSLQLDVVDAVGECLEQFHQADYSSEAFRYPENTSGKPALPTDITHINLAQLCEVMEKVGNFLEGAAAMLDHILDIRAEMIRDLGP